MVIPELKGRKSEKKRGRKTKHPAMLASSPNLN
jgi:hypothetical protein